MFTYQGVFGIIGWSRFKVSTLIISFGWELDNCIRCGTVGKPLSGGFRLWDLIDFGI